MRIFLFILFLPLFISVQASDTAEVYLLAGQSNMQGIGKLKNLKDKPSFKRTFFWNGKEFEAMTPGKTKTSTRNGEFGPEMGFAHVLEASPGKKIYLIKFHASGQPLHHGWDRYKWIGGKPAPNRKNFYPGQSRSDNEAGLHYQSMRKIFDAALKSLKEQKVQYEVKGILWMQGEQDSKNEISASEYGKSLRLLKKRLQEDLNSGEVPFIFGQVLPYEPALKRFTHRHVIRQVMADADSRSGKDGAIPNVWMVSTDKMSLLKDKVHYSAEGQWLLGKAMAITMLESLKKNAHK